jgi:tetratricopeptide (TPR) repeat protein
MKGWIPGRSGIDSARKRFARRAAVCLSFVGLIGLISVAAGPAGSMVAQTAPHGASGMPPARNPESQKLDEQIRQYEHLVREHPESPELWSNLGVVRAMAGNCAAALPALKRAQSLNPELYNPWFFAGYCYFSVHQDERAMASLERATHLNPRDPNAWFLKAQVSSDLGNLGGSLAAVARAKLQGESRAEAFYLAGKNSLDLASELFARVLKAEAQPGLYSLLLSGQRDAAMGVLDSAINQYRQALTMEPNLPDLHFALGTAFLEKGEYAEAEESFRHCLKLTPDSNWTRVRLALALVKQSKQDESAHLLQTVNPDNLELPSEFEDYLSCAYLLNTTSRANAALARARSRFPDEDAWREWNERLTDRTPGETPEGTAPLKLRSLTGVGLSFRFYLTSGRKETDIFNRLFLGATAYQSFRSNFLRGQWMAAAEELAPLLGKQNQGMAPARAFAMGQILQTLSYDFYKQLGNEFPDSYPAMKLAAENLQMAGQPDKALEIYQSILEKDGPSPDVLREMARINWTDHRWGEALKWLEPLAQMDPDDATIFVNLGRIYRFEQKTESAQKAFSRAIQIEPRMAEAHLGLGMVLRDEGDLTGALRELKVADRINPANPKLHYVLSLVYSRIGEEKLAAAEMANFRRLGAVDSAAAQRRNESLVPLDE